MSDCEVVITRSGAPAMLDRRVGELMHPVVGPRVESERLYLAPSRLRERLALNVDDALVLFDVGLGAGSNAVAAWRASATRIEGRRLEIVSFESSLDAFSLAIRDEHAEAFGFDPDALAAARALLEHGHHESPHTTWRLIVGDVLTVLSDLGDCAADVVFWDPFSPRSNPALWTCAAFGGLRTRCREGATVHTYSGATATRSALLLADFAVGFGPETGENKRATEGATDHAQLAEPLDARWLERLARSSAAFPSDAPADAMSRIAARAQFR